MKLASQFNKTELPFWRKEHKGLYKAKNNAVKMLCLHKTKKPRRAIRPKRDFYTKLESFKRRGRDLATLSQFLKQTPL